MVTQYPGNAIPAPAFGSGFNSVDDELLYSYSPPPLQKGVTLKPGQGVLLQGTFLDYDASTKKYVKTTTAADVKGLLRQTTDTGTSDTGQVFLANILYGGAAKLYSVSAANSGVTLTSVLNAQVDTRAGFFRF